MMDGLMQRARENADCHRLIVVMRTIALDRSYRRGTSYEDELLDLKVEICMEFEAVHA